MDRLFNLIHHDRRYFPFKSSQALFFETLPVSRQLFCVSCSASDALYIRRQMSIPRYCDFDPRLAKPRLRSVRINGFATCLRLEEIYWRIIEEIARTESLTVGKLISKWALEIDMMDETICNFTGFIRIICVSQVLQDKCQIDLKVIPLSRVPVSFQ